MTTNPLIAWLQETQQIRTQLKKQVVDFQPVIPPTWEHHRRKNLLTWQPENNHHPKPQYTVEETRTELDAVLAEYSERPNRKLPIKLIKVKPGVGKTYAAIKIAQKAASEGRRVLFLMLTHSHWQTVTEFEHFDSDLWYHWQPVNNETCEQFSRGANDWMKKGYPLKALCKKLCPIHQNHCIYRSQANVPEPIIAGVHEHAVTGLAISDFDLVVVDELPTRAFISPRKIPIQGITEHTGANATPFEKLCFKLIMCMINANPVMSGKELFDEIGSELTDFFGMVELDKILGMLPEIPEVYDAGEIKDIKYWFVKDLYKLLAVEHVAWESGMAEWLERVHVSNSHVTLGLRSKTWKKLPKRMVILDATAKRGVYEMIFPEREIEVYEPAVKMRGKIHQVTHRYNGKTQMHFEQQSFAELLDIIEQMIAKYNVKRPGFITFKENVDIVKERFQTEDVAYFYGQRGSNALQHVDYLFVMGTPSPTDNALMYHVSILQDQRIQPFVSKEVNGVTQPIRHDSLQPYNIVQNGQRPYRLISGFWDDKTLQDMSQAMREDELVQSIHRARPVWNDCHVWLFSSVPISEQLTSIMDYPPIAPADFTWQMWIKVKKWLDSLEPGETVNYDSLSEGTGLSKGYLINKKTLQAIQNNLHWEVVEIKKPGQGRNPQTIVKV